MSDERPPHEVTDEPDEPPAPPLDPDAPLGSSFDPEADAESSDPEADAEDATIAIAPSPPSWAAPRRRDPLRTRDRVILFLLVAFSFALHIARLSVPGKLLEADAEQCTKFPTVAGAPCYEMIPLDEVHYVPDARDVIRFGTESDTRVGADSGAYVVHPPVGKWFIAAGIKIFGDRPFGWRIGGAVLGSIGTLLIYLLARRLWRSPWWAAMAAFLLTVEGLWFVQSRVAMLDIYSAFFVLLGVWLLFEDRDRDASGVRWWRAAAAVAFGLAFASKWSTAPFIAIAFGLATSWEVARAHGIGARRAALALARLSAVFTLIPAVVYVATYTPWFVDSHRYNPPLCVDKTSVATQWLCYQREMLSFHQHLAKFEAPSTDEERAATDSGVAPSPVDPTESETPVVKQTPAHPYFGEAWSWPWIGRPVAHSYETTGDGALERAHEVLGLPNPAIWWLAFAELPLLAWFVVRRRDAVAPVLFAFFVAGFVPYLFADAVGRPVFMFYATPLVPFLVLTVVHGFVRLVGAFPAADVVAMLFTVVAAATFVYFYPVLAAWPVSSGGALGWRARMWLGFDCTVSERIRLFCWI